MMSFKKARIMIAIACIAAACAAEAPASPQDGPGFLRMGLEAFGSDINLVNANAEFFLLPWLSARASVGFTLFYWDVSVAARAYLGESGLRPYAEFSAGYCTKAGLFGSPDAHFIPMLATVGVDWQTPILLSIGASLGIRLDSDTIGLEPIVGDLRIQPGLRIGFKIL